MCDIHTSCLRCFQAQCAWIEYPSGEESCVITSDFNERIAEASYLISPPSEMTDYCLNSSYAKEDNYHEVSITSSSRNASYIELDHWMIVFFIVLVILAGILLSGLIYWVCQIMRNGRRDGTAPPIRFSLLLMPREDRIPIMALA